MKDDLKDYTETVLRRLKKEGLNVFVITDDDIFTSIGIS